MVSRFFCCSRVGARKNQYSSRDSRGSSSRVLVIGATGYIGKSLAMAAAALKHPTYVLVRPSTLSENSDKKDLIASFKAAGITILPGSLEDHKSLVAALKQVDVVISTVGGAQIPQQTKIISAIKEVGTIKRFFPSEFGIDVDRAQALEPAKSMFAIKAQIRRAVEEAQIPHTFVVSNGFAGYFVANLFQPGLTSPPRDKVNIHGSGNVKTISVSEEDVGTFTIKAMDDPRTLNKTLHIRPSANILTQNELVSLWEKKIGKTLEKHFISEEEIVKQIQDTPFPGNVFPALLHDVLIKGDQYNFELGTHDVEATSLYPDVKYTSTNEYLNKFL